MGLFSRFAADGPGDLRQQVHTRLQALLDDAASWQLPLNIGLGEEFKPTQKRGLIVQQSGDFYLRFDMYHKSLPNRAMLVRSGGMSRAQFAASLNDLKKCCGDQYLFRPHLESEADIQRLFDPDGWLFDQKRAVVWSESAVV